MEPVIIYRSKLVINWHKDALSTLISGLIGYSTRAALHVCYVDIIIYYFLFAMRESLYHCAILHKSATGYFISVCQMLLGDNFFSLFDFFKLTLVLQYIRRQRFFMYSETKFQLVTTKYI